MKKVSKFILLAVVIMPLIFISTACINDRSRYGAGWGDITIDNATPLPFWIAFQSIADVEGIQVVQGFRQGDSFRDWFPVERIIRVTSYDAFVALLTPEECYHDEPCIHDHIDLAVNERLFEIFSPYFFETQDLIIACFIMGVKTAGLRVENIRANGVINITETRNGRRWDSSVDLGIDVRLAIEVDSAFNPPEIIINMRRVYLGRR